MFITHLGRKVIMNNVMHLIKTNLLKLVMALLIAVSFALSTVGHAQSKPSTVEVVAEYVAEDDSSSDKTDEFRMKKSGSGWGG